MSRLRRDISDLRVFYWFNNNHFCIEMALFGQNEIHSKHPVHCEAKIGKITQSPAATSLFLPFLG